MPDAIHFRTETIDALRKEWSATGSMIAVMEATRGIARIDSLNFMFADLIEDVFYIALQYFYYGLM